MKAISVRETNFASGQIVKMRNVAKKFYFGGGELVFVVPEKMVHTAKLILGKSILRVEDARILLISPCPETYRPTPEETQAAARRLVKESYPKNK